MHRTHTYRQDLDILVASPCTPYVVWGPRAYHSKYFEVRLVVGHLGLGLTVAHARTSREERYIYDATSDFWFSTPALSTVYQRIHCTALFANEKHILLLICQTQQ